MGRVLEHVEEGHRAVREAVHKDRLELAFQEMKQGQVERGLLHARVLKSGAINGLGEVVKDGMNHERTAVLNQKHGAPADLGTYNRTKGRPLAK